MGGFVFVSGIALCLRLKRSSHNCWIRGRMNGVLGAGRVPAITPFSCLVGPRKPEKIRRFIERGVAVKGLAIPKCGRQIAANCGLRGFRFP